MNLRHSLHSDSIRHVDLSFYIEVQKGATVAYTIDKMQTSQRKCALVMDQGKLIGIFTAHDIARKVLDQQGVEDKLIDEIMTPEPITLHEDLKILEAIEVMNEKEYRYMPVVDDKEQVLGTLTHYAIIKYMSDHFPTDIYNLPPRPDQFAQERAGA